MNSKSKIDSKMPQRASGAPEGGKPRVFRIAKPLLEEAQSPKSGSASDISAVLPKAHRALAWNPKDVEAHLEGGRPETPLEKQMVLGMRCEALAARAFHAGGDMSSARKLALNAIRGYICAGAEGEAKQVAEDYALGHDGIFEGACRAATTCIGLGEHGRAKEIAKRFTLSEEFMKTEALQFVTMKVFGDMALGAMGLVDYSSAAEAVEAFNLAENKPAFEFYILGCCGGNPLVAQNVLSKLREARQSKPPESAE